MAQQATDRKWIPTVAGVFQIVAAITALIGAISLVFACAMINAVPDVKSDPDVPVAMISGLLVTIAGILVISGVIALIGGLAALRRRGWMRAVVGSVASIFLMPPAGIFATILTIVGESEFEDRTGPEPPA